MKLIRSIAALLIIALMVLGFNIPSYAAEPEIAVTNQTASVAGAPAGSELIVALYRGEILAGAEFYSGTDTIVGNYAEDMAEELAVSDRIKVFLWDPSSLSPVIPSFSSAIDELPESDARPERVLTIYFSRTGNTSSLAEKVQAAAGGDIARIVPFTPYPDDYSECLDQARQELNDDSRPDILPLSVDIEQYDVILLGYPIWFGECPPPVRTFLSENDLSGKTIMPFCTSGSSGISGSLAKIRELCPDSTVTSGFRGTSSTTVEQIEQWLSDNDFWEAISTRIKLSAPGGDIIIKLLDNGAAQDLADMLPTELDFSDFNNTEKIAYPPEDIDLAGTESGTAPAAGDLTIYAPWGNLALFYRDYGYSSSLVPLGSVESGMEYVTSLSGAVTAEVY